MSLLVVPTASAKKSGGNDTAEGSCHMVGSITFKDPLGAEPERTTFTDYVEGTCAGTVNGQFLADERVYLRAKGGGLVGCAATDAKSRGTMVYTRNTPTQSDDVEIDYIAESRGTAGQIVSSVRGVNGGQGIANVRFRGDEETLRQCEAGQFRGGVYDMDGQSITPLVG